MENKKIIYKTIIVCLTIYFFTLAILGLVLWSYDVIFTSKSLTIANIFIFILALKQLKKENLLIIKTILWVSLVVNLVFSAVSLIRMNWVDVQLFFILL